MAQLPKPHSFPNFAGDQVATHRLLDQTNDSLSLADWRRIPWALNWIDYDTSAWGPVYYTKDRGGFVHLRGLGKYTLTTMPAAISDIFIVPTGFYPDQQLLGVATCSFGLFEWQMMTTGRFQIRWAKQGTYALTGNYFNFSGISWWSPPQ